MRDGGTRRDERGEGSEIRREHSGGEHSTSSMEDRTMQTTFAEVLEREENRAAGHYDLDVKASSIMPVIVRSGDSSAIEFDLSGYDYNRFGFGPYGQDQFFQKVGIPIQYARKCLATPGMDYELLSHIIGWLSLSDATWKLRCDRRGRVTRGRETVRGVVSEHYVPFDNADLLKALAPIVEERGLVVKSLHRDDGHFNLKLTTDKPMFLPESGWQDPEGSDIYGGYVVRNSEIRLAAVSIAALVYRLICTNGLIAPVGDQSIFRQIHYGKPAERVRAILPEAIKAVDRQQAAIFRSFTETTVQVYTLEEAVKIVTRIGKASDLAKAEIADLLQIVEADAKRTRPTEEEALQEIGGFALVNAMTRYANTTGFHFTKQDRLESEVGRFVLSR